MTKSLRRSTSIGFVEQDLSKPGRIHISGRGTPMGRVKSAPFNVWTSSGGQGGGVLGDLTTTDAEMKDPYRQEPWVYRCVGLIANALTTVGLKVFDRDPTDPAAKELPETHPVAKLLADVNPWEDPADMMTTLGQGLGLPGECFLFLEDSQARPLGDPGDSPAAEIPLPAQIRPMIGGVNRVRAVVDPGRSTLTGWEINRGNGRLLYPPSSTLLIKYKDPGNQLRGLGPMGATFGCATQLWYARRFQNSLLRNGGDSGGSLEFDELPEQPEIDRVEAEIEAKWNNPERAGETRTVWGGKYHANLSKPKDMEFQALTKDGRFVISAVYGVPGALLGDQAENFATFKGHLRVFWTLTVMPILELFERAINSRLLPRMQEESFRGIRVAFDLSAVEALQGNLAEQAEAAQALVEMGVPLNQALMQAGIAMDAIDGGDVGLVATGRIPLVDAAAGAGIPPEPEPPEPDEDVTDDDPEEPDDDDEKGLGLEPGARDDVACRAMADRVDAAMRRALATKADEPLRDTETPSSVIDTDAEQDRRRRHEAIRAPLDKIDVRLTRALKRVYNAMRKAQLQALDDVAAQGIDPQDALDALKVYGSPTPQVSTPGLKELLRAHRMDADEARQQGVTEVHTERSPCGCENTVRTPHAPRVSAWLEARPYLRDVSLRRLFDLAWLARTNITEDEIDSIIATLDQKYADALDEALQAGVSATVTAADAGIIGEIGSATFFQGVDSTTVEAFRDKVLKLAEGELSEVAQRVRTAIIRGLEETNSVGSLADQIHQALTEVKASVRSQFNQLARRARTIARTEMGQVSGAIRNDRLTEAANQGIIDGSEWLTSVPRSAAPPYEAGGFVRKQHWEMDGRTKTAGESWTMPDGSTLRWVKDPAGSAEQIINCKCEEAPHFPEPPATPEAATEQ